MIAAVLFFQPAPHSAAATPSDDPAVPAILAAAESLFQTMKDRDYPATWAVLTAKSRDTIVAETEDAIRAAGGNPVPKGDLRDDFAAGGPVSRRYWESFLRHFDPDAALERSRWEMGVVEKDRAARASSSTARSAASRHSTRAPPTRTSTWRACG